MKESTFLALACLLAPWAGLVSGQDSPCEIQVLDRENGWPVPMVELRTTSNESFYSDNAGRVAFDLPEFMGRETWFHIKSPGYSVQADGFGSRGVRLTPMPGEKSVVHVDRKMIAKRVGRLTGSGLFSESQQLGYEKAWKESGITGCDSVQNTLHNGKLFWAWGDTNIPRYPLGNFHMTGAWTSPNPLTSFEPPLKLDFNYLKEPNGRPRGVCKMEGAGPTWMSGCVSLPDRTGTQRLVGTYLKIKAPMECYRAGLCVWDEGDERFEHLTTLWEPSDISTKKPDNLPEGNALLWTDESGKEWALFGDPFPRVKCPATFEAWSEPSTLGNAEPTFFSEIGGWCNDHPAPGSIAWNAFRQRWVTIFVQTFGKPSFLGEIWYAEAKTPLGPWGPAVKVLSHDQYTFYNPRLHPGMTPTDSPILLFEGTYSRTFSATKQPTPKYDYNQILYRLDLDDESLTDAQR